MIYEVSKFFVFLFAKTLFRFKVEGKENIPKKGGFLLCANHTSYLDPVFLGLGCPRKVVFMGRDTLFHNRFLALWMRLVGVVPVKREAADFSAMRNALRKLKEGKVVAIFPEGTRRLPEKALINPQPGAGFLAQKAEVPVIPAYLAGTFEALPKGVKGKIKFGTKILVRFGKQMKIAQDKPYLKVAEDIMSEIRKLKEGCFLPK